MKLCKLKLKNLNSFRRTIELDFEKSPLDDASLVAITGPTGAGKTTLLDAICIALYGKTPRLSGTGSQHPRHLISHGETEGFAEVHFEANGPRYIAVWSIKRERTAEVRLSNAEDGKLISDKLSGKGKSLGSSQRTVSEEVESLLGLDFDTFKRSVMLAQGEFAAFLKASREERRTILEAIAGIGIYEILKDTLNKKVREVEASNAEVLDKFKQIPEASQQQVAEAETELDRLQTESTILETTSHKIQGEKAQETKRKEDFEKLQSSEMRQAELLDEQPAINTLRVERENAECARHLRPEKRDFDNAKSELESGKKALRVATVEKMEAKEQVQVNQNVFDEKQQTLQAISDEHDQKTLLYNEAQLDVQRAANQFTESNNRITRVADLDDQINARSDQLADRETEQCQLQEQIKDVQAFLDANPLPSDRQHRLNRATGLLAELSSQGKQLGTTSASQADCVEKVSLLEGRLEALSREREKFLAEEVDAKATLESAITELDKLQTTGTPEEWHTRKQQAVKAQPIAQKYEAVENARMESENRLLKLKEAKVERDTELEQIGDKLTYQAAVYQSEKAAVQRCEETRESALLANPINKLRQHLHTGEPCLVCGAMEHPYAGIEEIEDDDLLQNTEVALEHAKTKAEAAQDRMQDLQRQKAQTQQNIHNTLSQIEESTGDIERLQNEKAQCLREWKSIYSDNDVSPNWITKRIAQADTAIENLREAKQTHTQALHHLQMVTQQLEISEGDVTRETKSLRESKEQLQNVIDAVEDLKEDIAFTENSFWDLLPDTFHGVEPKVALDQFDDKIKEVEKQADERNKTQTELKLLNSKIEADQNRLETLQENRDALQSEINQYQRDGEAFADKVREKTDGLETEAEINAAIDKLDVELKTKEGERDDARQELQNSGDLLTQKQTTHEISERRCEECSEKFEAARDTYFDKLNEAGFDSPETHDKAFRDPAQMQELTDQIDAYKDEEHQLALKITKLRTRFEETPFDSEALDRIKTQADKIEEQRQAKQKEVGAQEEKIKVLKDALERREALGDEMAAVEAERMRWRRLEEVIPANDLRDFALEIMFKQMGSLANEQLNYLTSERYQLKVETIGDLTVVDRWNANEERPVETLSGGESFLTSLALALALADLSRGRAQLNSLFLDEGFGTLDTETLDIAIAALERLRMQGRSIFLISHVQELTRRLPVKINVRKHGNDSSDGLFSSSIEIRG